MSATADSGFPDSEFDWEAHHSRTSADPWPVRATGMDLLAWVVLLLLTFSPPLGFAIALVW